MLLQGESIVNSNIYIRSKNRPNCITSKIFDSENIQHNIVVEPQDYEKYLEQKPATANLLVLGQNDGGFDVVRHFVLNKIRESGQPGWYVDDDIETIAEVKLISRGKMPKTMFKSTFAKAISAMENDFYNANVALGAPVTQTWCCFNDMTGLNFRKSEYNMVYMNAALLPEQVFTENFPWRLEDASLALRTRLEGKVAASHNDWAIGFPAPGVNSKGGASEFYAKKFAEGVEASIKYYEKIRTEYVEKLSPSLKKQFGDRKLHRTGVAKSKARKGTFDVWPNHSNIVKLSGYLRESGAYNE